MAQCQELEYFWHNFMDVETGAVYTIVSELKCCLAYENDYYNEVFKQMPKIGSEIKTKDGRATVESNDLIRQTVTATVQLEDGSIERRTYKLGEIGVTSRQNTNEIDDSNDEKDN